MIYEYEGKTEKEAIEKAASELGLERDQFDVEILETQKKFAVQKRLCKDPRQSGRFSRCVARG